MSKKRFQELDCLRGLAALLVVFFHFTIRRDEADLGFKLGTTGVDLFFIISGFVILLSLENIDKSGKFVINRISRLYPTYWVSVTLVFLSIVLTAIYRMDFSEVNIMHYLANMTMFQFYMNIDNLDGPYWTLIIEMLFYILMLVLFHWKLLKYINIIGVSLMLYIVLNIVFNLNLLRFNTFFYWIPLLQFWPLFFAGIIFYKLITENVNKILGNVLIILCLVSQISLFDYGGRSNNFITMGEYSIMLTLYFSLFILFVNNKLKFIINGPSLFLGKISYALYLNHEWLGQDYIIPFFNRYLNFWLSSIISLTVSLVIATLITYFVETPYSRKMRDKLYAIFNYRKVTKELEVQSLP